MEYRVPVYDGNGNVVGRVRYNQQLDYWDGRNWSSGEVGKHLGITRLKDGRYVLIHGSQWEGERATAEVVSDQEALEAILKTGNQHILKLKKYKKLKDLFETMPDEEDDDIEDSDI